MPPNARLRIRLIGPSGHKSEYHCATLLGNWQEERMSFGLKDPAKEPLEGQTTYLASYRGTKNDEELLAAKPPGCFCAEAPVQLLFYHGDIVAPPQSQFTVHELSYTRPTRDVGASPLKTILDKEGISQRREKQRHCAVPWDSVGIGPPLELRPPSEETQRRHLWRIAQGVPQKGTTNICKQRVVALSASKAPAYWDVYRRRSGS
ncbi:hypothetical protein C3747_130g79 [Trypanosoma cruzi]|uniref:Uncharacterized protein n=1 Tax=Trypanosoma cruzi TaxID=5693 RepID=A0A2V2WB12_TRYCR|nr:hypothetical protein C3747_130g79 [Trypanosoma cruzi]